MSKRPDEVSEDRCIRTTRTIDAPRELVWQAWTEPRHLAAWWGPTGFATTTHAFAFRAGGQWQFTMHGPDGRDYDNRITFLEVEAPSRLVYRHDGEGHTVFTTTVTFETPKDAPQRTVLTLNCVFPTAADRDFVAREYGAVEGAAQTVARLAEHVASLRAQPSASTPFVTRRVVRAPIDLVWRAFTTADDLAQWFGPAGCTLTVSRYELRPGGVVHYAMHWPTAPTQHARWTFRSITPPHRLEFVLEFADGKGNATASPFAGWPREILTVVSLAPHAGIGRGTVVTVQSQAMAATRDEQQTFDTNHDSMQNGWSGTFDRLDAWIAHQH